MPTMQCLDTRHDNSQSFLEISSTDHANITQYFPCIDHVSIPPYISEIAPILPRHRKKSRIPSYSSLSCSPPSNNNLCFRGVYDGFDEFVNYAHDKGDGDENLLDRIALLLEKLILDPEEVVSPTDYQCGNEAKEPKLLAPSVHRRMSYAPSKYMANYAELHSDYYESGGFVYSAILYDDPTNDLVGGETALVDFVHLTTNNEEQKGSSCSTVMDKVAFGLKITKDTANAIDNLPAQHDAIARSRGKQNNVNLPTLELISGIKVAPKRGRLVVFSSGGENFHAPLEVKKGRRPVYHFWFKCKNMNATASTVK